MSSEPNPNPALNSDAAASAPTAEPVVSAAPPTGTPVSQPAVPSSVSTSATADPAAVDPHAAAADGAAAPPADDFEAAMAAAMTEEAAQKNANATAATAATDMSGSAESDTSFGADESGAISQEELDAVLAAAGLPNPPARAPVMGSSPATRAAAAPRAAALVGGSMDAPVIPGVAVAEFEPPAVDDFGADDGAADGGAIGLINDVSLDVKVELGRTHMRVEDVLQLGPGSVVELDKLAGDPVEVYVNERLVARGEVLVLNDDFCVRISEIITPTEEVAEG